MKCIMDGIVPTQAKQTNHCENDPQGTATKRNNFKVVADNENQLSRKPNLGINNT